jgi:hypothetical protein
MEDDERLRQIDANMDVWLSNLEASYDQPLYETKPAIWKGLHQQSIGCCNDAVAIAYTFYASVRVHLYRTLWEVPSALSPFGYLADYLLAPTDAKSLEWSRAAC